MVFYEKKLHKTMTPSGVFKGRLPLTPMIIIGGSQALLMNFYFSRHGFEVTLSTTRERSTADAAR